MFSYQIFDFGMKVKVKAVLPIAAVLVVMMFWTSEASAQDMAPGAQAQATALFALLQIDQMLAPIAAS
ncbi:hypothetical protein LJR034_009156 [Caballeronia sp. LjRoot34]|uniref:hypothetical protein n=1 Tax=Caballeronia sp. LjRoot34 TaxID=3342325 RepID=UPI003ECEFE03